MECLAIELGLKKAGHSVSDESLSEQLINERHFLKNDPPEILDLDKTIEEFRRTKSYRFIYLVYAVSKKSKYFSPYSFKVVSFKNVNENCFFTLSNEGMMSHIENDVKFTSFARFEEDYKLYKQIAQVSVCTVYYLYPVVYAAGFLKGEGWA